MGTPQRTCAKSRWKRGREDGSTGSPKRRSIQPLRVASRKRLAGRRADSRAAMGPWQRRQSRGDHSTHVRQRTWRARALAQRKKVLPATARGTPSWSTQQRQGTLIVQTAVSMTALVLAGEEHAGVAKEMVGGNRASRASRRRKEVPKPCRKEQASAGAGVGHDAHRLDVLECPGVGECLIFAMSFFCKRGFQQSVTEL